MQALLELKELTFAYQKGGRKILDALCLEVFPHSRIGIVGDNGTGKSTLFHLCTGLLTPNAGEIIFAGKKLCTQVDFQGARLGMGYLLQQSEDQLFCPTVLEDVAFAPLNAGKTREEAKKMALETLQSLGLEALGQRAGCDLSGGEQKMAALASVLSIKPKLLLLDEPSNDLDKNNILKIKELLRGLDIPYVMVSHDLAFLEQTATSILLFENGRLHALKS